MVQQNRTAEGSSDEGGWDEGNWGVKASAPDVEDADQREQSAGGVVVHNDLAR
jgi:hypothetical protein